MKTLILAGLIAVAGISSVNAASNSWLRNTDVCSRGTLDDYALRSTGMGAVEHPLSTDDVETIIRVLYHRYMTPTHAKLFTHAERMPAIIFGDSHGCYMNMIRPRIDWVSRILGREIVHPVTS